MGVGIQSGQVSILNASIAAATPTPSSTQTHVNRVFTGTGSNQNVYTVTSGKTFYLMGVHCPSTTLYIVDNAGTTNQIYFSTTGTLSCTCPLAVYTSGQIVKANGTNATGGFTIWGVEQ